MLLPTYMTHDADDFLAIVEVMPDASQDYYGQDAARHASSLCYASRIHIVAGRQLMLLPS